MFVRRAASLLILAAALLLVPALACAADPPPGATSCSGCHPPSSTIGSKVPVLAGRDAGEIANALEAYRSGKRPATVMDRIAKGFTPDESRAIADWYHGQRP